ncbi:MAG: class I SAM-dependent methyltransferase [Proteobacteria bacterium]|nr:class I SAM-dependent methyltransferase [Pseudomonadota bacterium]
MRRAAAVSVLSLSLLLPSAVVRAADAIPSNIAAAVADPGRPASDRERDANRKPAQMLAYAGVKPGDKVGDYAAGQGYFTRLFAAAIGPKGHVYATVPAALFQYPNIVKGIAEIDAYAKDHPNVSVTAASAIDSARYAEKLDLFWISQNYHDLKDPFMGPVDMAAFNKAVFAALKPGGTYIVLDHVAAPGSPADVTDTLHRIEPAVVRREVEAAGFTYVGQSNLLENPSDPHNKGVFDPSIRGKTDQFVLKFRKP